MNLSQALSSSGFTACSKPEAALCTAAEAPPHLRQETLAQLVELFQLGLVSALLMDRGNGVSIFPPLTSSAETGRFGTLLRFAMGDNVAKLREAKLRETRPRETHLFVAVGLPVWSDPARTTPPPLPEGLDTLWVYLGYWNAKYDHRLWRTTRVQPDWELLEHPLGEPAPRYDKTDERARQQSVGCRLPLSLSVALTAG